MYSHLFTKKPVKDDPSLAPLSSQASRSTEEVDLLEDAYDDPIGILACAPIFREESDCPREEEAAAVEEGLRVAAAAVAEDVRVAMAAEADIELEIAAVAVGEEVAVAAVAREEIASAMEEAQAADGDVGRESATTVRPNALGIDQQLATSTEGKEVGTTKLAESSPNHLKVYTSAADR